MNDTYFIFSILFVLRWHGVPFTLSFPFPCIILYFLFIYNDNNVSVLIMYFSLINQSANV